MGEENEFSIVEKRDEDQILASLQGEVVEEYFYETRGKTVISWMGVKEIARQYGNIDTDLVDMKETDTSWIVVIKAKDIEKGNGILGTSVQNKLMNNQGAMVPDEFCIQKAFSKAQRNAIKSLIPEAMFAKALEKWNEGKKSSTSNEPRRQAESTFDIMDFMRDKELKAPEEGLKDALNQTDDAWDSAKNITEAWLSECGFKPGVFKVMVNATRIAVKPEKDFPLDLRATVSNLMIEAGFTQTRNLWRLQKKEVTG